MSQPRIDIRHVLAVDLVQCLQWLLPRIDVERAESVVAQVSARVQIRRSGDVMATELRCEGNVVSAAVAILQPPAAATLVAISSGSDPPDALTAGETDEMTIAMVEHLKKRLANAGVRFLQFSTATASDVRLATLVGFQPIADLAFMVLESPYPPENRPGDARLRFELVADDAALMNVACQVAERSFEGTLDSPRLNDFRSASEIVEGFRSSPTLNAQVWQVLWDDETPVGCLILMAHSFPHDPAARDDQKATDGRPVEAYEIHYMGIAPGRRRRGLGSLLISRAVQSAEAVGAKRLVLAVDRENAPAITLYHRHGFQETVTESVWGMRINP